MWTKLKMLWEEAVKKRKNAEAIAPATILRMADELEHLALLAERSQLLSNHEAQNLHSLHEVITNLKHMVERPEFIKLSADRRLALNHSLERSRQKLLESMQAADSPTERMQ